MDHQQSTTPSMPSLDPSQFEPEPNKYPTEQQKKNKRRLLIILFIIFDLLVVGGIVAYFMMSQQTSDDRKIEVSPITKTTDAPEQQVAATLKTYTSTYLKVAFDYPSDWKVEKFTATNNKGVEELGNTKGDKMLIVAPSGFTMFFEEMTPDGLGGICMPIAVSGFNLDGVTRLPNNAAYVISYTYANTFNLYLSSKSSQQDANDDSCHYNSLIKVNESSQDNLPTYLIMGNRAIGEDMISTKKPSDKEYKEAVEILTSTRQ